MGLARGSFGKLYREGKRVIGQPCILDLLGFQHGGGQGRRSRDTADRKIKIRNLVDDLFKIASKVKRKEGSGDEITAEVNKANKMGSFLPVFSQHFPAHGFA